MWDLPRPLLLAVLVLAALPPLVAVVAAFLARSSSRPRRRVATVPLLLLAAILTYLHPLVQEMVNQVYLEPKLERARAMNGESVERLFAELGEPDRVVGASPGVSGSYGYALYGPARWTPLGQIELVVPLTDDGERVSVIAHLSD